MAGAVIGIACGALALWCLARVTRGVVSGNQRGALLPMLGNMAAIGVGLFLPAVLFPAQLVWAGVGMAAVLVIGAIAIFIWKNKKSKKV